MDHQSKKARIIQKWLISFSVEQKIFLDTIAVGEEFAEEKIMEEIAVKSHRL